MTQVTLEHREPIVYGPMSIQFTKFDTDDKQFENEANELRQKWHREYDENLQRKHEPISRMVRHRYECRLWLQFYKIRYQSFY